MKIKLNGRFFAMSLLACSALAGCGGGDSSSAVVTLPITTAEGIYKGIVTNSGNTDFRMLVLENGDFWTLYGNSIASVFNVAGFLQGTGTSDNGKFTSTNAKDFGLNPAEPVTLVATYDTALQTIAGTASDVNFTGGPIPGSLYNYSTPASLATVAGSWLTNSSTGESVSLTIASNGEFNAISSLGCNFSGTVTPRPSGKNVFNVALTFGAAPCGLPNQFASGIALAYPLGNGKTELLAAVTNLTDTHGIVVSGTR